MPSHDAWTLVLQFVPELLFSKVASAEECRDVVAVILAQRPPTPGAWHSYLLTRLRLVQTLALYAQSTGRMLLTRQRINVAYENEHRLPIDMPSRIFNLDFPFVFNPAPEFGEGEMQARINSTEAISIARARLAQNRAER